MRPETLKLLEDVRRAAERIRRLVGGRSPADYASDELVQSAVERQFEIIGEALNRLAKSDPDTSARIGSTSRAIAFRNVLSHVYD